jgi:hypothetical protein
MRDALRSQRPLLVNAAAAAQGPPHRRARLTALVLEYMKRAAALHLPVAGTWQAGLVVLPYVGMSRARVSVPAVFGYLHEGMRQHKSKPHAVGTHGCMLLAPDERHYRETTKELQVVKVVHDMIS